MRARILCLQRDCEPNERKKGEKERDRETCVRLCLPREKAYQKETAGGGVSRETNARWVRGTKRE